MRGSWSRSTSPSGRACPPDPLPFRRTESPYISASHSLMPTGPPEASLLRFQKGEPMVRKLFLAGTALALALPAFAPAYAADEAAAADDQAVNAAPSSTPAAAPGAAAAPASEGDIVVTARRRAESAQQVP